LKRSRYTVEFEGGAKRVILAYTAPDADSYYRRFHPEHGTPLRVTKGDYRKRDVQALPSRPQWRKHAANIQEAIDFLGLTQPVSIKVTGRRGGRHGAHQLRGVDGRDRFYRRGLLSDFEVAADVGHYITVKSWLTPQQAGETIWHELCHAMQAEQVIATLAAPASPRDKYDAWNTCEAKGKGVTYLRKPIEVEAREYQRFNDEIPLAV
jgi:hypothetical protein